MEMGELLRKARLEAGLTQRALCGDRITRNMLSQIENGTARPSMATLQYLADALGKPVSYFLGEVVLTANQQRMLQARQAFAEKRYRAALSILGDCETPDETLDWERGLLGCLCCLSLAEEAAREGRRPVARKLLGQARRFESPYITPDLRTRQELLAQQLPSGPAGPGRRGRGPGSCPACGPGGPHSGGPGAGGQGLSKKEGLCLILCGPFPGGTAGDCLL